MPLTSHRINLLMLPSDPEQPPPREALRGWLQLASERDWLQLPEGDRWAFPAGQSAEDFLPGGFALFRLDLPSAGVLYGNRQGGFSARCPGCLGSQVQALQAVLDRWRGGAGRRMQCAQCGESCSLEELRFRPPAAPARWALEWRDVQQTAVRPQPLQLPPELPPLRWLYTRG